jgi:hypothetical protein
MDSKRAKKQPRLESHTTSQTLYITTWITMSIDNVMVHIRTRSGSNDSERAPI